MPPLWPTLLCCCSLSRSSRYPCLCSTGNYIDRPFSSGSGNIGERRPRRSPRYPTLLASSFNLLFLHHFIPPFSSSSPLLTIDHQPPPSAWNLLFSSISLSFHSLPLFPFRSLSLFLGFHPRRLRAHTPLSFSIFLSPDGSPRLRRFSDPFSPSFSSSPPPLFHDVPDKRESSRRDAL